MKELIKRLTEAFGPAGSEEEVRELIRREVGGAVDRTETDALGNLYAIRQGDGKRVMLAAHMDEIGVMVTHIDEKGFLRFTPLGGVYPLTLLGNRVVFAGGLIGTFGREKPKDPQKIPGLDELYIDVGAPDRLRCR